MRKTSGNVAHFEKRLRSPDVFLFKQSVALFPHSVKLYFYEVSL